MTILESTVAASADILLTMALVILRVVFSFILKYSRRLRPVPLFLEAVSTSVLSNSTLVTVNALPHFLQLQTHTFCGFAPNL